MRTQKQKHTSTLRTSALGLGVMVLSVVCFLVVMLALVVAVKLVLG